MNAVTEVAEAVASPLKSAKIAIIGGMIAVFLVVCGLGYYFYKQHMKDQQTIGQVNEQKENLKEDLKVADIAGAASNAGQTVAADVKKKQDTKVVVIRNTLDKREAEIKSTIVDPVQQAKQLSVARMESVWSTYCLVEPDNATCQQTPPSQDKGVADQTQVQGPKP